MSDPSKGGDPSYSDITGANGIPAESTTDLATKEAYKAAQAKLVDANGNPTSHYQTYLKYQDEYNNKVKVLKEAHASALTDPMKLQNWPIDGVSYHNDVDEAMDRWVSLGFKNEIEKALATLATQGTDPDNSGLGRLPGEG